MKSIITLLLSLTTSLLFSQDLGKELLGDWVKYKTEMKDGSRLYDRATNDSTFLRFAFRKDNVIFISFSPEKLGGVKMNFNIERNVIQLYSDRYSKIGLDVNDNSYLIEKVTEDTLVIVENFNLPDDKLKRYYCINQFKLSKDMKNRNSGKESYVANRYCTPIIKKEGINFKAPKVSFEIYGYMIFDMVSKNIDIEVTNIKEGDINDKKIIAFFDNLKETYDKWHLSDFKQFKTVKLPFYIRNAYRKKINADSKITSFQYSFATNTLPNTDESQLEKSKKSYNYYNDALLACKELNYEKAIEFFTLSYQYDNFNIESLYSRANVYYHLDKKEKACTDWKTLSDLGQTRGANLYKQHCKE